MKERNIDLTWIGERNVGISDYEVMDIAIREERTIITFDRDYTDLIFKHGYKPSAGVIYLRIYDYTPDSLGIFLLELIKEINIDFKHKMTVVDLNSIRQRIY